MDINQVLTDSNNRFEVENLLRRYRVLGPPTIDTVKKAHDAHGETFMMKLLQIITPTDNFTSASSMAIHQNVQAALDSRAQNPNKGWTFWDKLLNQVGKTGETIGNFKQNINPQPIPYYNPQAEADRNRIIMVAAGALVLIIVLILLFKK